MLDNILITVIAKLRIKKLLWPSADDPEFLRKITSKQRENSRYLPWWMMRGFTVSCMDLNGYSCYAVSPKSQHISGQILFIHGGAFVLPISNLHWRTITDLVRRTGQTLIVPEYPLVPGSNYVNIHNQILAVYEMIKTTTHHDKISVVGDSAGGNLALALLQLIDKSEQPGNVVLLSPVVDLRVSNTLIDKLDAVDPLLPLSAIRHLLPRYYTGSSANDPLISPLFADYSKTYSKLYILNGGKDLLSPDIELFHRELLRQNVPHCYVFEKYLSHAWPIFPLSSSRGTRKHIAEWCSSGD